MSVYNGNDFLRESLDSVIQQTFSDFEFIIIDDGSEDNTWSVLSSYAKRDHRIVLSRNEQNLGQTRCLNSGLAIARGTYIARQDHDDVSHAMRLERQVARLDKNPEVVLVSSNFDRIDGEGRFVRRMKLDCDFDLIAWNLLFHNYIGGHSQVMFRRDLAMKVGGYSESFAYAQDYDLWARMLQYGKLAILPDVLLKYRQHDHRVSAKAKNEQTSHVLSVSRRLLSGLIGEELDVEEVRRLWSFWGVNPPSELVVNRRIKVSVINKRLQQIYRCFLRKHSRNDEINKKLTRRICLLIGERYLKWAVIALFQKGRLATGYEMLFYSTYWLRFRLVDVCLRLLWQRIMMLTLRHLVRWSS